MNIERALAFFESIVVIDSPSGREGRIASYLESHLRNLGCDTWIDDVGERLSWETGNLLAYWPGRGKTEQPPLLLCAHMDTVVSTEGVILSRVADKLFARDGGVIGADDKSGIAIIVELIESLMESREPAPPLEILFTVGEEVGLAGAKCLEKDRLKANAGVIFDSDSLDRIHNEAPGTDRFTVTVRGRKSHSGTAPEAGVNAVAAAARAIGAHPWGRIDGVTTVNVAGIRGGDAFNVIPDKVDVDIEIRSRDQSAINEMRLDILTLFKDKAKEAFEESDLGGLPPGVSVRNVQSYPPLYVNESSRIIEALQDAATRCSMNLVLEPFGGGFDGSELAAGNIQIVNVSSGQRDIHTEREWLDILQFERSCRLIERFALDW